MIAAALKDRFCWKKGGIFPGRNMFNHREKLFCQFRAIFSITLVKKTSKA
jgi:hypothetical protein